MKNKSPNGRPALELIEEATHLLRNAPGSAHICYYLGTVPFVLALLHFWSDMSRGAFAYDRIGGSSLVVALLFVWMKSWQAVAGAKLYAYAAGEDQPKWSVSRVARLILFQAAVQPTALFLRPLALLITIPYGWVRAFYENAVIVGDGSAASGELAARAKSNAALWPKQNLMALFCLLCFGSVVWLNLAVVIGLAPHLLKIFTGIETAFTESMYTVFNTTFVAAVTACTYLCVNPITKAVYVLRCFHGGSVHSGDDLRLEMRRVTTVLVSALILLVCAPSAATAGTPATPPQTREAAPAELNTSIEKVLKRDEFAWRMPRQQPPVEGQGFLSRFLDDAMRSFQSWIKPWVKWMGDVYDKIWKWMNKRKHTDKFDDSPSGEGMSGTVYFILWGLCALIFCMLGCLLWRSRKSFRRRTQVVAEAVAAVPDLTSEDLVANQLPEDEWLKLAREMMGRGEFRLAIRALYLSALAHLGLRELIAIARYKSNRDYQRELRRRARTKEDLLHAFGESISIFEDVWYGAHETTEETVRQFSASVERIRAA